MPVHYKDYYATLGVAKAASQDEVRKAFRQLARKHHPDVAKDKKTAEAKFKEINEAYEVLGDAEKRKRYDELGADWERGGPQPPQPGWGRAGRPGGMGGMPEGFEGTGFSDFFEQFFSGGAGRRSVPPFGAMGGMAGEPPRGGDIEADLLVTIEEALHGGKKKISFRRDDRTPVETYEVRIPKGVREGQKIRLAGQGQAGGRRGPAGDLYLAVRFEKHPDYRISGADLYYDLPVPAWMAVLGGETFIPTPDGSILLKVPPGSQPGRKFRLRGRGLPSSPIARGDFYAEIAVMLPTELTPETRKLWEELAKAK
ncbi:MAG: J domain-containing protein [Verrucomicrobia bacterium]|nr:MAG: J domain-containing protein [Verrucomicrobiota bacterium]